MTLAIVLSLAAPGLAQEQNAASATAAGTVSVEPPRKPAEVRAEQLDILFGRLHVSKDDDEAKLLENKIWTLWTSSDSPTAEVLLKQATRAMNDGAPRESLSILNRLIGTFPDFAEAWNKRATLYFLMKRDFEALLDIQRVLDLEPRHFGALSGRGLIYQRQKRYSDAERAFQEALSINPGMATIKSALKALERLEQGI